MAAVTVITRAGEEQRQRGLEGTTECGVRVKKQPPERLSVGAAGRQVLHG